MAGGEVERRFSSVIFQTDRSDSMTSRRAFLAYSSGTSLALFSYGTLGIKQALAQIPGGTLDPATVPKFATPLLVPPVMPRAGKMRTRSGKNADYYEISMKQFSQQILPAGLPATTVWGYGSVNGAGSPNPLLLHNAPSLTIEATAGVPVVVKWINDLKDANGNYRPHLLPVDPTLHWANPPGGTSGRDMRPTFTATPGPYTGPVPMVTHVHGAVGVGDDSDGYAEAWYLPAAANLPAGYATNGTWHEFFKAKATASGTDWGPGYASFTYPNANRASTLWYHDHALGMTRLNVYAGPAGFYLVRGGPAGDVAVLDSRTGRAATLPGPAPREGDAFPPRQPYYEIPLAIQDRSFNADGSLFYPDTRAFFDGVAGPYLPQTDLSPIWNPEFFGNMMIVNGRTWPFLEVEQRRYRFRLLNGCQSRFLILDFSTIPGVQVWQIGNEGGFLAAPVDIQTAAKGRLLLGPAERADVIVDFANVPRGAYQLGNIGPDEPFGGGEPPNDFDVADPATTGKVLQFRVGPSFSADTSTPPAFLVLPPVPALPAPVRTRRLALIEEMSMFFKGAPAEALLGTVDAQGVWTARMWADPVTENPSTGDTEVWEIYNTTADAHPMHVHEVVFQVINRQDILVAAKRVNLQPNTVRAPEPWETGYKDTVIAYPGQVTRIRARFDNPGQFVWHCHIVEHEDNEMMRPYRIGPRQVGQPG
jgi:FtsP/CotA-like multicopper oxidase with cupredoxin domain